MYYTINNIKLLEIYDSVHQGYLYLKTKRWQSSQAGDP